MAKKFVIRLSYDTYAVHDSDDAVRLLQIVGRLTLVKQQNGYSGPYIEQVEATPLATLIEIAEVLPAEPTPQTGAEETAEVQQTAPAPPDAPDDIPF